MGLLAVLCSSAAAGADLEVGRVVDGQVGDTGQPVWHLALKAGDLVRGRVDGDVSLRLLDAEGRPLRLLVDGLDQPREFLFVAAQEGRYGVRAESLAIRPAEHFSLRLEQVVPIGEQRRTSAPLASPTLRALQRQLATGGDTRAFWKARAREGTPLVEAIPGQPGQRLVTFLWRGAQDNVRLFGAPSGNHEPLSRLGTSDVWYGSFEVPAATRLSYQMAPDVPVSDDRRVILASTRRDPLNPNTFADGSGDPWLSRSRLELPDAASQPWVAERAGVPRGSLERKRLASQLLGNERDIYLYRPVGWRPGKADQALLVLFDAHAYTRQVPTPTLLDNLIADGLIPPTAALIIANPSSQSRERELPPNPLFARFMAEELMPWASGQGVSAPASRTVVAGSSYGGLASAYMGLSHPELFGNVLSMSGSYWWPMSGAEPGWLTREYVKAPRQPLRFYLQAGLFEGPRILDTNRHLRDVLLAKGYRVEQVEFPAGHDYLQWRGSLPCGLISLIGQGTQAVARACVPQG
ncbi:MULTISPECIES: alpha/beta hydrolase-fold protein [unclassified Pseudomonas]|uniref:alpha/beta hydrolase-fold protein n=1 Tax=unclassified Pseudomonas TaxID=196821 RepID=UPI00244A9A04|nr:MULTISPECIES: alpha/beta hydrolase-fold protein [unclassified Pseudomonas]MDH0303509.1 alpha/beta hydrolase-fold protein [Pseudomonas sp. GD04091]MDH1987301.1 alpha/beta hydrolase-fold protein [Pseudomonas sp. GD03689]